ncbi:hypothetical protein G6F57_022139 [Rhizopus arrhizus]|nr:hypothetical protein G6F57_022139 [Rhizopus arrhizus]
MGVRQHDGFDLGGRDGKLRPVPLSQQFDALEQAAIQQYQPTIRIQQVARTGNRARRAQKPQPQVLRHGSSLLSGSPQLRTPLSLKIPAKTPCLTKIKLCDV